ncbi:hypothetical protein ACMXYV_04090 [Neptuniibacter sp. SY11_33]|uniref:L,D-transpeptidase Cds6 family protein n=1 Tax=Neptuniibacter sp. SY11_33 TaxID=3398215 RepID=UPI0039F51A42
MLKESQLSAENIDGTNDDSSSFTGPYRHAGYKHALNSLREALNFENAVILKGVEGTGKTTLVGELISEFQHKGVPIAVFNDPLTKTSQLYSRLAETLEVPKQKRDLIKALRNTKEAGQFCLVVVDQQAINSDDSIVDALQQLCETSETTAGAIKLVVVRQDYMVLHPEAEGLQQADFSNWVNIEVTLDPLHTDDIEGYIYYLSALKGIPPTPYEIGTDFMMIEQTEGRISRLKAMLLPLIHKDVITRNDFMGKSGSTPSLASANSGIFALGFAVIIAIGIGINHFFLSDSSDISAQVAENGSPIFAEPKPKASIEKPKTVAPPSLAAVETAKPASGNNLEQPDTLPALNPELEKSSPKAAPQTTNAISPDVTVAKAPASAPKDSRPVEEITSLPPAEFQAEVNSKLTLLEEQLSAAIEENNRLKQALEVAEKEQTEKVELALAAETTQVPDAEITHFTEVAPSHISENTADVADKASETSEVAAVSSEVNTEEAQAAVTEPVEEPTVTEEIVATETTAPVLMSDTSEATQEATPTIAEAPPIAEPVASLEQVTAHIERWTNAWQAKDHETYANSYISGFNGAYRTHQRWLKKRHDALNRPEWIKLTREEFQNIQESENELRVDFWLKYEAANGYKDKTLKRLTLVFNNNEWLIAKEQNIKVEPYF